jgi:pyruvate dehydrogenase E2 component (dihydrolipoamide acetyltransferase)
VAQTIVMPALSAGMEEGTIGRWLKGVGDAVAAGDVIAEIETDKATMELEAEQDGVIGKIVAVAGETVPVNGVIALLLADGESASDLGTGAAVAAPRPEPQASPVAVAAAASPVTEKKSRISASPLARRTASEKNISLTDIAGSGPRGRIVRRDVELAATAKAPTETMPRSVVRAPEAVPDERPAERYSEVPLTNVRKVIARRLAEAKATIPHFYLNADCEIDALLALRETLNAQGEGAYKLSVNDFIVKASALALRQVPEANAAWSDDAILMFQDVDISVAVATDGGLITPIVRRADGKGLATISAEVKSLAERARAGRLQPNEYQGGGFTISNLGMYGVRSFSAIINPPQSCILAVGAAERRSVVRGDACVPATVMSCTLSVDHRSVDGAVGARYLAAFKAMIEQPLSLML